MTPYAYATLDDLFKHAADKGKIRSSYCWITWKIRTISARFCERLMRAGCMALLSQSIGQSVDQCRGQSQHWAIEYVPVARVTNLAQTIKILKDRGMWIFGTAMDGQDYRQWDAKGSTALVIGNEGKGISPGIAKLMDATIAIPMVGHVQSLNASVAAGILMYQAFASRHEGK